MTFRLVHVPEEKIVNTNVRRQTMEKVEAKRASLDPVGDDL